MLKLNQERSGKWYQGVEFEDSHLITNENHNKDLGISGIIIKAPNTTGKNGRVFGSVTIRFTNGLAVFGSLYVDKAGNGLTFGVDQRTADNGERFDINVRVPMAIQAQVLRFAMTKAESVASVPAPAKPSYQEYAQQQAPVQQAPTPQVAPVQEQPSVAQAPVQATPAPATNTGGFSPEFLNTMAEQNGISVADLQAQISNM